MYMHNIHGDPISLSDQRWEFIKENKKVRKQELDQESDQENKNLTKKAIKKTRKQERKQELDQEKRKNVLFFLNTFLVKFFFLVLLLSCFL